ncbi:MFS transporter [Paraburkholderia phytofirmans]|uniref:MFS transporter n=1 Tax=Paraburkholderia phytofirmans OLGA172 TaxID=1417228 RepID=A0A160FVD3_9BURK|nr:MFS transporter [Paraburkholderia phytofirmans]ANB77121.1 MFS transporter [Paraburkholderia phytofirmans OLGA172]
MNTVTKLSLDNAQVPKTKGRLLILLTLAIGFVMAMIDVTAVNVALPDISLNLSVPLTGLVWVVDGYTLTFAALLLAGGALADRLGSKRIYQAGLTVFLLSSALCGIAPGGGVLIGARLLQGAGAAMFMPSSLSLLTQTFEDEQARIKMFGIWSAMVGASSAVGPLIGGVLVHQFGWRSVFLINLPIGVLGIGLTQFLIPATPKHEHPLSLISHGLAVLALGALSFFLIEGPNLGWLSAPVMSAAAITGVTVIALVQQERRGAHPLLPRALFQTSSFTAINVIGFLFNFGMFGLIFLLSLYLQQARGADALQAGLQLLPIMIGITAGNLSSSRYSARFGMPKVIFVCSGAAALMALTVAAGQTYMPYPLLLLCVTTMSSLIAVAIPAMTTLAMQIAGRTYANSAAAALNANRQIGALVGVALMGIILHTVPGWNVRLQLAFVGLTLAFGAVSFLIYRFVGVFKPASPVGV